MGEDDQKALDWLGELGSSHGLRWCLTALTWPAQLTVCTPDRHCVSEWWWLGSLDLAIRRALERLGIQE